MGDQKSEECQQVVTDLRSLVSRIPTNSFTVKRALPEIEEAWKDGFWNYLIPSKIEFLRLKVGPFLRLASDVDVPAETFAHKIERLKLNLRTSQDPLPVIKTIMEDIALLPEFVLTDYVLSAVTKNCAPEKLANARPKELNELRDRLAAHMKNKRRQSSFLSIDLADVIDVSGYILLTGSGEQVYVKEYRRRVEERILKIVENHPV